MKRFKLYALCLLVEITLCSVALAGGGPENVLLVVNANSASSLLIANEYIQMRDIHPRNVVYLEEIPDGESMTYEECKRRIILPIVKVVQSRKLAGQISYIVYSSDFPTTITTVNQRKAFIDFAKKSTGRGVPSGTMFLPAASLTSLTYFLPYVVRDDPGFMGLNANYYSRRRNVGVLKNPFFGELQGQLNMAIQDLGREDFVRGEKVLLELHKAHPQQAAVSYWMARRFGLEGKTDKAVEWIKKAARSGWTYRDEILRDNAFQKIRDEEAFTLALESIPNSDFTFLPTRPFNPNVVWGPNGMINGDFSQGSPYFLSTILGVTRNLGNSEFEVVEQLRRTVGADFKKPKGTFYFTSTKDVRSKTRLRAFDSTISELNKMGLKGQVVREKMPSRRNDIAGLMLGSAYFDVAKSRSKILPGAICDNLTSYGGLLTPGKGQTKISELIRHGAAGASGTVIEPLAIQAKFPHPNLHLHYTRGCSLAESFYQSVEGPFQLLIVGDALCQPWATPPKFTVAGLEDWQVVSGKVDLELNASKSLVPVAFVSLYLDGVLINRGINSSKLSFDSKALSDGYHELRIVATAKTVAETQGRVIVPFVVNNNGSHVELRASKTQCSLNDTIQIEVESNVGDEVKVIQNMRTLAVQPLVGGRAVLNVSARLLGRGNSRLLAMVADKDQQIRSKPGWIQVLGPMSKNIPKSGVPKRLSSNNADHLAVVQFKGGHWLVCDDFTALSMWTRFTPEPDDRLIGQIDFDNDRIIPLEGENKVIGGIDTGFASGDVSFITNQWGGESNEGEFYVKGSFFELPDKRRFELGQLNLGVAAHDKAKEDGFVLFSKRNVHERFANTGLLHNDNADHLVVVRNHEGKWQANSNSRNYKWLEFEPQPGDHLIAEVDLTEDTIKTLKGRATRVRGIGSGFRDSDLTFQPNQWNGKPNPGEFGVKGSFFSLSDGTRIQVGNLGHGIGVDDKAGGKAFVMYSRNPIHDRF